jgi:hypothetical protein
MADLNSLIAQGAQFNMPDQLGQFAKMQQIQQGMQQQQLSAQQMQTGALQQKAAEFQLQKLQEDHANMVGLQQKLSQQGLTPRQFFEALQSSKDPQRQQVGIEGLMKLGETEKYEAYLKSKQTIPAGRPPMQMGGALGTGTFGLDQTPGAIAPAMRQANALAPQAAPAAADPVAAIDARLAEIQNFADPRAQAEAARLQKQRDELVKPHVVGDFLVSGAGNEIFKAPKKSSLLTQEEEAQKLRIAAASRAPAQPRPEQPPVAVVDPVTGKQVFVSREEALKGRMTPATAMEGLTPKEIQTREAKYPQATLAVKTFESKANKLAADLKTLANHPGLSGISGLIYGRTPAVTAAARQAQSLYDSIVARGGFSELQAMRSASPTGGALGNVSEREGQYLRDAFAAISRTQDTPDLKKSLLSASAATIAAKQNTRDAYDMTYDYKTGAKPAAAAAAPGTKPTVSNW